jgi:DNA-binding response OmpR family regulator
MRCDGAVLSAEDLLNRVWGETIDQFSNVVQVTMSRLRRKLGEPSTIETVTNAGYRITEITDAP